jgi:hypothetical protein
MKGITITSIATLCALYLAPYDPSRTGGQGEKDSAGGLNAAQGYNRLATDARDVKQSVKNVRQHVIKVKQRITDTRVAKRHGKGAKRSMTYVRQDVKQQVADREFQVIETRVDYGADGCATSRCEGRELRVVETPGAEQLTIDVMRPTKDIKAVSVEFEELSVEPMDVEYVRGSSVWAPARGIYLAVPERQECPTPYDVRVELNVQ